MKMKLKKMLTISFLIAFSYLLFSLLYFFDGLQNPMSANPLREVIETFIVFPAIIIFGVGFSGGSIYLIGFLALIGLWVLCFIGVVLWTAIGNSVKNRLIE